MLVKYLAVWFLEENDLINVLGDNKLDILPEDPLHITLKYRPSDEEVEMFKQVEGEVTHVTLVGIGNDGKNAGFQVELSDEIQNRYNGTLIPHITMSLANGALAKDTVSLVFKPMTPVKVNCKFGYFIQKDEVEKVAFTINE